MEIITKIANGICRDKSDLAEIKKKHIRQAIHVK